jgi:hypothetical protein
MIGVRWIISSLLAMFVVGGTIYVVKINWDKILIAFKGKKIVVLGEKEVGKTHLIQFLCTGSIPSEYNTTGDPQKYDQRRFFLKNLELDIHEIVDFSGDQMWYQVWEKYFNGAEVILYLFRADRLFSNNSISTSGQKENEKIEKTYQRIEQDIYQFMKWEKENGKERYKNFLFLKKKSVAHIIAIGTHCDLIEGFSAKNPNEKNLFYNELVKTKSFLPLRNYFSYTKILLGSMEGSTTTEDLVYRLFSRIQTIYEGK